MNKLTKIWTGAVAYVALGVGSGVSIAGNVADTYRTRPGAVDAVDIILAVFAPLAVLFVIEMFVSTLWPRTWGPQVVRWTATVVFGVVAAYVSWHHLSDLLLSRGQDKFVSWVEPLSIDGLAIMATALVLSSRRAKSVQRDRDTRAADVLDVLEDKDQATLDSWRAEVTQDIPTAARPEHAPPLAADDDLPEGWERSPWTPTEDTPPLGVSIPDALPSWLDGLADRAGGGPSTQAHRGTPYVSGPAMLPLRNPGSTRLSPVQRAEIRELTATGRQAGMYSVSEIRTLLAAWYEVHPKTIQRAESAS